MRVLWISNIVISEELKGSGSWIFSMAHALLSEQNVILGNIVPVKSNIVHKSDYKSIRQWKIPKITNQIDLEVNKRDLQTVLNIISEFKPDIIHIWGIENGFSLITPYVDCPVLIEIQGINSEISKYYYADFQLAELFKLYSIKEFLTFNSIFKQKKDMSALSGRERKIFELNKYFTVATDWMKANVQTRNNNSVCFSNGFILRDEFYNTSWKKGDNKIILTSASNATPYKGIHLLLDALSILKNKFPDIQLRIIGPFLKKGLRTDGYVFYLHKKIKRLGLKNNVLFLGSLNAGQICNQILESSVFANPSFIESAGMTILESMSAGIPVVSSYAGGIPSLAQNNVLYFQPGDYRMLTFQVEQALDFSDIIKNLTVRGKEYINLYHNKLNVVDNQLRIYKTILSSNKK